MCDLIMRCGNDRDNNLGMWSRGPNGDGISVTGPEYSDDMAATARLMPECYRVCVIWCLMALLWGLLCEL